MKVGGRFELIERVGVGGSASVYRALDGRTGMQVAVKMIHPDLAHEPEHLRWFVEEADLMQHLEHTGLPRLLARCEGEEPLEWFALEYIDGRALTERPAEGVTIEDVLSWGLDVSDVLVYLHDRGIVHRDVKPDNILVRPNSQAMLIDLGIAHHPRLDRTQVGAMLGTPAFMPPEQAIDPASVEARSDIYSLGVSLFAAFTRRSGYELAYAHTRPTALECLPPSLRTIIERATQLRIVDRHPTALHLLEEFSRALEAG